MGRQKLLLPLRGRPVVRWSVEALLPLVDEVVVVTGHEAAAVGDALAGLSVRLARNPHPEAGQGTSIAVGIGALGAGTRAALVALGDQPRVPRAVVQALLETFARTGQAVVTPVYRGVPGNPVLFAASVFPELRGLSGDIGARALVRAHPERVAAVELDLPMPADVDTPEDLAQLQVE